MAVAGTGGWRESIGKRNCSSFRFAFGTETRDEEERHHHFLPSIAFLALVIGVNYDR